MEIVTCVLEGALAHRDSLGTGSVIRPGELQRMTAGTGITHSEYNASDSEPVHLYQIWLLPEKAGLEPSYEQREFPIESRKNRLRLVASPDGEDDSLVIRQNARIFLGALDAGRKLVHEFAPNRHAWVQVLKGAITLNGTALSTGDGAASSGVSALEFQSETDSELMVFDLS
jgi:redox-sensitive bicupin YhaK (pirin superfamily)